MLFANSLIPAEDLEYIVAIRRELHRFPEIGFDLPRTVALVKRELDAMGIPYTEEYGQGSVVGIINGNCTGKTIGLRADMDALPVQETADVPFKSEIPGAMHACGHDSHAAMLLGAARALKRVEKDLKCRVKLLFQPSEEGDVSGAAMMVANGVADDVDMFVGLHTENTLQVGKIGIFSGEYMAACHPYTIEFHGKSVHATQPHRGHDALAMAVKAYNDINLMKCRELDPFAKLVLSVSSIQAGHAHNVITNYAKMLISFRFYNMEVHDLVDRRIKQICRNAAEELDGTVEFTDAISCPAVYNALDVCAVVRKAAVKVVGEENLAEVPQKLSSEDFAHYLTKKPGAMIRIGTRNEAKGCTEAPHNSGFILDEDGLINGSRLLVQFVLEQGEVG